MNSNIWPVAAGHYYVGRKDRPVAISTLSSLDLMHRIGPREEFAIIGKTFTENLGIEKVVQISSQIRQSASWYFAAKSVRTRSASPFIALKWAGVDPKGRIVGDRRIRAVSR
jgi:tetrahydromethanopterin S-methyltransferase subunit A